MAKLSALARTKEISFVFPGTDETLNLTVVPDQFTGQQLSQMQEAIKESEDTEAAELRFMCAFLAKLIKKWDLTDEDGNGIPITEESLFNTLPVTIVGVLLNEIQKGISVNP